MSNLKVFPIKDPAETIRYVFDYSTNLTCDETIESATSLVNYVSGSGDPTSLSEYLIGIPTINGSEVSQEFSGGLHLSIYDLRVTATTSLGQVLVRIGRISVISLL